METTILLCRHGNTFNSGETPFMVGSKQDLELTEEGESQAQQLGIVLSQSPIEVEQIISAPLRRTQKFAHVVKTYLTHSHPTSLRLDVRLSELDYGEWSGKTASEIENSFGVRELRSWNELGEWPKSVSFSPSREQVERELRSLLGEIVNTGITTCLVTSQGRIKVFADILKLDVPKKMGTGRVSVLKHADDVWRHHGWNLNPSELEAALANRG
jgi:broad specificity phosphatase PhoE